MFVDLDGVMMYLRDGAWVMSRSSGPDKIVWVYVETPRESDAVFLLQDGILIALSSTK